MSNWKTLVPRNAWNYVLNPSAETTGNFAARAAATVTRETSVHDIQYQTHGLYSYYVVTTGAGDGIDLTLDYAYPPAIVVLSAFVRGTTPSWRWRVDYAFGASSAWLTPELVMQVDDYWYWYQARADMTAEIIENFAIEQVGAGIEYWYLDGLMATSVLSADPDNAVTYIDGDQPGCEWTGTPHASLSYCTSNVRSQGFLYDFQDDLHFDIGMMMGTGAATHTLSAEGMALLPGASIMGERIERRSFALGGIIRGTSEQDFHDNKLELLLALSNQVVPELDGQKQPVQIWYTGALPVKEITAYYESGLEANMNARTDPCYWEQNIALQFTAADPLWYSILERSTPLSSRNTHTGYILSVRQAGLGAGGWASFGEWVMPSALFGSVTAGAGGNKIVYAAVWGPDRKLYFGGDFTDYGSIAACDHIACYDPSDGAITAVGGGLNHVVRALCFGPDGTLYAGGFFTNAGGDGDADYIAQIDPDAAVPAWSNVGGGPTALATVTSVNALCFDINGNLVIGGNFTNWGNDGDRDYALYWDGAAYQEFDEHELDGAVNAVAASPDGYIYFGGAFHTSHGDDLYHVCRWRVGSTDFEPLNAGEEGVDDVVHTIVVDSTGRRVWLGGEFHDSRGGETLNHVGMWNGTNFEAMASGATDIVRALALGPDDALWVGGDFATITGVGACSGMARWVSSSWVPIDMELTAAPDVYSIAVGKAMAPSQRIYNVSIGFDDDTVVMYCPMGDLIRNGSSWLIYPKVIFKRTGAVTGRLGNVRIGPSGAELYLNYTMRLGETLTVDTSPMVKTVSSDFYGQRTDALLPPSDLGAFTLFPQVFSNSYTDVFWHSETAGDTDLTCYLLWRETFESQD